MRTIRFPAALLGLTVLGLASVATAGCFAISGDDVLMGRICEDGTFDCFATTTSSVPTCEGDPTTDASVVTSECGVFVKAGATGGDGTKEKPFGSFVEAVAVDAPWIFVCAGEYAEDESVTVGGDVSIFGGFTGCGDDWKWSDAARATLMGPADKVALKLLGGTSLITNVNVTAADAVADGGSSIAVVVSGGKVEIRNGELVSGKAMDGAEGESLGADVALNGVTGTAGAAVCDGGDHPTVVGAVKACADGSDSTGGDGGAGGPIGGGGMGGPGTDGTPPDETFPTFGVGGKGEGQDGSPVCTSGTDGAPGAAGGPALAVSALGDIDETGYLGVLGNPGEYGKPGQGGGGGGGSIGASGVSECTGSPANVFGASGGAGGSGGCGGKGGGGGGAGGASIALLSLNATVTLADTTLKPGKAGQGGVGGTGQKGGDPGSGGAFGASAGTAKKSCDGGTGGTGGFGGSGGGGTGGHAVGIAFKGTAPKGGTFAMDTAAPGDGGDGGPGNESAGKGSGGMGCKTLSFDDGTCAE